jgi:hypothetical protein
MVVKGTERKIVCALLIVLIAVAVGTRTYADSGAHVELQEVDMASFSLQALHDEIENDPAGLGYKEVGGAWKEDAVIADQTVRAIVTYDAYNTLALDEQEWIRWMTPNSGLFQVTADMKLQLSGRTLTANGVAGTGADGDSFWAAAHDQDMAPAMLALIEIDGSRAEVLWGEGKVVTISEIGHAANL